MLQAWLVNGTSSTAGAAVTVGNAVDVTISVSVLGIRVGVGTTVTEGVDVDLTSGVKDAPG